MAEYPIHPYIIHCLEPLLANAAAPVVLADRKSVGRERA